MNPENLPGPVVEAAAAPIEHALAGRPYAAYRREVAERAARAALGAALPLLALDRDTIARWADETSDPYEVADAVLAASPLRTVTDAQAEAWDDGYNDAATMAHCYGHTDGWPKSDEPRNPYRADRLAGGES